MTIPKITAAQKKRIAGTVVCASISGGKDSAAMSLWLTENGVEHRRVFADTGWEHPATYEYLRGPLAQKLGPIDEVRGEHLMADLVRKKGMFPSRVRRFCTEELKVKPLAAYVRSIDDDTINAVGIRAAESKARANLPEWDYSDTFESDVWRPLIAWTEADVIGIHTKHGLAPNPLYLRGAERVGCWPCIFSRKKEIALVAKLSPERIDAMRQLEADTADAASLRYAARGETFESLGYQRPTFFAKSHRPKPVDIIGIDGEVDAVATAEAISQWIAEGGSMLPIDEAVAWARTDRGSKQLMLLDTEPAGCVRWGLCESAS